MSAARSGAVAYPLVANVLQANIIACVVVVVLQANNIALQKAI